MKLYYYYVRIITLWQSLSPPDTAINNAMGRLHLSYEARLFYWQEYRDEIGGKNVDLFKEYIILSNKVIIIALLDCSVK